MTRQSTRLFIACIYLLLVVANSNQSLQNNVESKLTLNARTRILQSHHDDKHVDADDHTHALEIHSCEGTELELHGDTVLHAENVDNTKEFLVTDKELDSCEEIENLRCKSGAALCKRWGSRSNENVELKYSLFQNGKAHFYALPENKDYVMSVTLKLHPQGYQNPSSHSHHSGQKEEHVHDDSQYHSLEIHDCTTTDLDLPEGHDALLDVTAVGNAKRFMVTDLELDNCDEIKRLQCKSGNQFCHTWDAHANEMIVLEKEHFKNHQAYLYVEAQNEQTPVSINVKVVPAEKDSKGDFHAINDPHPDERNHGKSNGSHEEKHLDVDGHIHAVQLKACTGTTIELHGDAKLSAKNVFNAKRYMVTNIEMQTCEAITAFECAKEATYCHIWNANGEEVVPIKYGVFPNHEAFFYADPIDHNQEVSINIKVVPEGDQHGHKADADGVSDSHMVVDSHTHALELKECSATTFDLKGDTVLEVENVGNAKEYMVTDVKLETCEDILAWKCPDDANICHIWHASEPEDVLMELDDFPEHEAHFYVKPIDPKQSVNVNAKLETLADYDPTKHHDHELHHTHGDKVSHFFSHFLTYGLLVVLVLLFVASYCYRRYMSRFRQVPFDAPFWCPSFIFPPYDPEAHQNFITSETKKQENTELNSGIIRQVDV